MQNNGIKVKIKISLRARRQSKGNKQYVTKGPIQKERKNENEYLNSELNNSFMFQICLIHILTRANFLKQKTYLIP